MAAPMTLKQIEELAAQLPPAQQLQLAAHICEHWSRKAIAPELDHAKRLARVNAYLAECDAVAEQIEGEFDSAEDLRQIRADKESDYERRCILDARR